MDKAKALELIKRVAAMLLMACFFMPLSQCSVKIYPEAQQARADFHVCGYEMAQDALRDIEAGQLNGVAILGGLLIVFFVPAACLGLKDSVQTPIYLLSFVAAACLLYGWIFLFATKIQYGGVIAAMCWISIFCAACLRLRSRKWAR